MYGNVSKWDDDTVRQEYVNARSKVAEKYGLVMSKDKKPSTYVWMVTWRNDHHQSDYRAWLPTGEGLEELIDTAKQDTAVSRIMVNNFAGELVWQWRRSGQV